jgi:anti-sigma B factor antagonist
VLTVSDDLDLAHIASEDCSPASAGSRPGDSWLVVVLPREIDVANADKVRAELLAAIDCGSPVIVADMSLTEFCDCAGVTALLAAGKQAAEAGAELRLVARAGPVLRTFEITGLSMVLAVHPTSSAALCETWSPTTPQELRAEVTQLSRRRRTGPAEFGPQPDRQRCP